MIVLIKMNCLLLFGVIAIFASQSVFGFDNKGPAFEIREGNCTKAILDDVVFQDHVHKYPIPFVKRDAISEFRGDRKIYCIMALSQKDSSEKSTVEITQGGVNQTYATLKIKSIKSHGFEYNIQVFGK